MKIFISLAISAFLLLTLLHSAAAVEEKLKPSGYVGMAYRAPTGAEQEKFKAANLNGIVVTKVLAGSPAEKAGLLPGDLIMKLDEFEVPDQSRLITLLRSYHAGDKLKVTLSRAGKDLQLTLALSPFPKETADDLSVEYTSFASGVVNLRAVVVSPLNSGEKKLPALLFVSALGSPRLAALPFHDMSRRLAYAAASRGFRVMRFELRGYGDSEGEDYRTTDFNTEINDNLAALDYLLKRSDVDAKHVFVMGHSTGGQIAAVLAARAQVAGLVTSGTIGRTYYERALETLRIQGELSGDSPDKIDKTLKDFVDLLVSVSHEEPLESILKRNPDLEHFVNKDTRRIMDDRTPEYWKQQLALNLAEIYSKVKVPVLIIRGRSDFLTQTACHEHIRDVLKSSGSKDVTLVEIPDMDHKYAQAGSMKESFENYKTQDFKPNDAGVAAVTDWLVRQAGR
jgi:pimeloyl-ACP methyl ester carboxylesterase